MVNESGATVQYVDDPDGLAAKLFDDTPPGVAVITIDALHLGAAQAEVELHLWLCQVSGRGADPTRIRASWRRPVDSRRSGFTPHGRAKSGLRPEI